MARTSYTQLNRYLKLGCAAVLLSALLLLIEIAVHGEEKLVDNRSGYWGEKTANTNWCEEDYVVTSYIAEFGNTVSSLFVVFFGLYGLVKHAAWVETRYVVSFVFFIIVGFGSVAFHATLWRTTQLFDELPMLWCNGVFFYILFLLERDDAGNTNGSWTFRPSRVLWLSIAYTTICTILVVLFDNEDQLIFLISYGGGVLFQIYTNFYIEGKFQLGKQGICLGYMAMLVYLLGFNVWLIDRRFCSIVRPFHLHSFWHFFAGLGTFTACLFWLQVRLIVKKQKFLIKGSEPLRHIVLLQKVV